MPEKLKKFHHEIEKHIRVRPENKIILLVERLDYTKGLINRIKAYREFLEKHDDSHGKVSLLMYITTLRENDHGEQADQRGDRAAGGQAER